MSPASPLICQTFLPPPGRFPALHGCGNVPTITKSVTAPVAHATLAARKLFLWKRLACFIWCFPPQRTPRSPGMDDRTTEAALSLTKFGVGQPVRRSEDPTLVRGRRPLHRRHQPARPGLCGDGAQPRCPRRHPRIDTAAAKAMPGVLAVYTAADLTGYGPLKCNLPLKNRDGSPIRYTPRPALAGDKVRFVGDPVACVIAETVAQAKDAAEAVALDIEPLPPVLKPRRGGEARRAAAVRRGAEQYRARLSLRRRREGRRRLRQGRACHAARDLQSAHGGQRHRAARGDRRIRRRSGKWTLYSIQPGRASA